MLKSTLLLMCLVTSTFVLMAQNQYSNFELSRPDIIQNKQPFTKSKFTYTVNTFDQTPNKNIITNFSTKQQMPHYIVAGTSIAAIGTGFIIRAQSQNIYNDLYLPQTYQVRAEPSYQDANKKHHQYLYLSRIGGGLFVANAVWYLVRRNKLNKAADVSPNFELTSSSDGTLGVGFSVNF